VSPLELVLELDVAAPVELELEVDEELLELEELDVDEDDVCPGFLGGLGLEPPLLHPCRTRAPNVISISARFFKVSLQVFMYL
jgi:hypothetical protein